MVLIFTDNEQLDRDLNKRIEDSRIVYYPDYVLEEKDATTLILNKEFVDKHKEIWDRTVKKYDFMDHNIDFEGAVYYTRGVARDLLQRNGEDMPASTIEIFSENKKNR